MMGWLGRRELLDHSESNMEVQLLLAMVGHMAEHRMHCRG
jgi:hypothetical protein